MILFPLSTFFFFQNVLFKNDQSQLAWSGLAAVVAVNIVIYSYVMMAWRENSDELENDKAPKPFHSVKQGGESDNSRKIDLDADAEEERNKNDQKQKTS